MQDAAARQAPAPLRKALAAEVRSLAPRGLKFASACSAPAASFDAQLGRTRKLLPEASL